VRDGDSTLMPGVDNPFSLCHTLTTTHPESHGTSSCTNSTVFAFHATILTRIQDGKIMHWNNYTGTAIDKGLILSGRGMQTQFFRALRSTPRVRLQSFNTGQVVHPKIHTRAQTTSRAAIFGAAARIQNKAKNCH
jgi:hypothetical protein